MRLYLNAESKNNIGYTPMCEKFMGGLEYE